MALNYVQVTGTFDDGQGSPLSGTVTFTPNVTVYAAGIPVVEADVPVQAQIIGGQLKNASGGALQLLATDNTGLTSLARPGSSSGPSPSRSQGRRSRLGRFSCRTPRPLWTCTPWRTRLRAAS